MAAIWNDIEFEWEGEPIKVKPTLNFINKIEQQEGASLSLLLRRMQSNDLPIGISCHVIGTTLREGGVIITTDEVYDKALELGGTLGALIGVIVAGCLPMPKGVVPKKGKPQAQKS